MLNWICLRPQSPGFAALQELSTIMWPFDKGHRQFRRLRGGRLIFQLCSLFLYYLWSYTSPTRPPKNYQNRCVQFCILLKTMENQKFFNEKKKIFNLVVDTFLRSNIIAWDTIQIIKEIKPLECWIEFVYDQHFHVSKILWVLLEAFLSAVFWYFTELSWWASC